MAVRAEKISDAEAEIMKAVWKCGGPVTYARLRTVLAREKGWESPTVNTLVNRLVKKGALRQERKEVYYYTAAISEEEYTRSKTEAFVEKVYNGNVKGLMSALISYGRVTQEDVDELRARWKNGGEKHE